MSVGTQIATHQPLDRRLLNTLFYIYTEKSGDILIFVKIATRIVRFTLKSLHITERIHRASVYVPDCCKCGEDFDCIRLTFKSDMETNFDCSLFYFIVGELGSVNVLFYLNAMLQHVLSALRICQIYLTF